MLRARAIFVVLMLALALVASGSLVTGAAARTNGAATRVLPLEDLLLQQVNAVRQSNGLAPFSRSGALTRAAAFHSLSMATLGFFTHESRNGGSFAQRVERFYRPRTRGIELGENLATFGGGAPTAETIVAAWMASPGHRAILLRAGFREAGIGIVHHPQAGGVFGGAPTWVITLDVGRR
jgi:uncharacterized protein YkwD